ncbi:MAG: DUF3810 domain-containing protein, partial [Pedobacter sp.]|nr:DUF3810 domain-containing protein [Pedobacter sp.]
MAPEIRTQLKKTAILFAIALLIFLFGMSSNAVEFLYSDGFYQFSAVAQRLISSIFPFALGDFMYLALVLYVLYSVFRGIKKLVTTKKYFGGKSNKVLLIQPVNFTLILYIVFKLLWGLNYSRPSITGRLGINNEKYTTKDLVALGDFLIKRVNKIKAGLPDQQTKKVYTAAELAAGSKNAYDKMVKVNPFFKYRSPALKPVLFSWLITKIGIEGYY